MSTAAGPPAAGKRRPKTVYGTEREMIWPSNRLLDLLGIDLPIIQAPMAGLATSAMAAAVPGAGGLGPRGCAGLRGGAIWSELRAVPRETTKRINVKFFWPA